MLPQTWDTLTWFGPFWAQQLIALQDTGLLRSSTDMD